MRVPHSVDLGANKTSFYHDPIWACRQRTHIGDRVMLDENLEKNSPKSRSLFHYTTGDGLLGIVKDRCLFATHADFSNDSSECKLILPHLIKVLADEYEK